MVSFNTIAENCVAEFSDKGSKFIAIAAPIANSGDFKFFFNHTKEIHPKAVHYCFAFRIGYDKNNYRTSDDGEPSGSAGKPILGQIDSKLLTNVSVIVVRYFGGVLLGVPGLINAYKTATANALNSAKIIVQNIQEDYLLEFDYLQLDAVLVWIKRNNFVLKYKELDLNCKVIVSLPIANSTESISKLNRFIKVTKV